MSRRGFLARAYAKRTVSIWTVIGRSKPLYGVEPLKLSTKKRKQDFAVKKKKNLEVEKGRLFFFLGFSQISSSTDLGKCHLEFSV